MLVFGAGGCIGGIPGIADGGGGIPGGIGPEAGAGGTEAGGCFRAARS